MLKKRLIAGILAVLSFFVLGTTVSAFELKGLFGKKEEAPLPENTPRLKVYMENEKIEPVGNAGTRISSSKGAEKAAALLYDGDTSKAAEFDNDAVVTIDMGATVMLSGIRYYADKIEEDGNNCLGTRFYASNDNKNYVELAVIEGLNPPENGWYELNFSGFGEYRYFRAAVPPKANLCEIEWMGVSGFTRVKQPNGKYSVGFELCAFDAAEDIEATLLIAEYNSSGVVKKIDAVKQKFPFGMATYFKAELADADCEVGDSYRIAVFEEDGNITLDYPLNYRVNGAASNLSVSSVFGDNMVLQADKPVVIWGKAPKNRVVEVTIENRLGGSVTRTAEANANSEWEVSLGSFSSGGEYTITVKADGTKLEYKNITFGDVWICTGQSNMDFYMMGGDKTAAADLENKVGVRNLNIRLLNLWNKGMTGAAKPVDNPPTGGDSWYPMDVDSAAYCSAVGYYFAREIQNTTGEPVGIINVAVGDTEINRWISKGTKCGTFTSTDGDLYNNRIYPFEKLNIKGIILYQGEADQYRTHLTAKKYSDAMAGLVDSYRSKWGANLPFYWAQLTRYRVDETLVREGQRIALSKVANKENTGMIVLNDLIGDYEAETGSCRNDIHPWGKKTVAERFAAYAKRDCYDKDVAVSGPVYKSAQRNGNKLVLTFECTGELKVMPKERYADKITDEKIKKEKIDTSKPMEFEIAGSDGNFVKADAVLDGNTVILSSESVSNPVYARYAWGAYPEMPNLTDNTGLPTATFTTEDLS